MLRCFVQFDVVIGVLIGEQSIETQLGYWDNSMKGEYIEGLGKAYVEILTMILRSLERKVSDLEL